MFATQGLGTQQLLGFGLGDLGTHTGLSIVVVNTWPFTEAKPTDGYTLEALPSGAYTLEGKPIDGYTLEPVPTRPGVGDGFWTDGTSDGFYDEYPSDGFYAKEGYDPEPKPLRRATPTLEGKPN
jgi:hypothetical protein